MTTESSKFANGTYTFIAEYSDGTSDPITLTVGNASTGNPANQNEEGVTPKTGDSSHMMLWILLSGASLTVLGGTVVTERKRKKYRVVRK